MARNLFVNVETGAICKIKATDKSYAYIEVIHPASSSWGMPRAEYDTSFVKLWRPAQPEDLARFEGGEFELPTNAPADWK